MKQILLTAFAASCALLSFGQSPKNLTVKGSVTDSVTKQPVSYATIGLQNLQTKAIVKSVLTKDDGSFELSVPAGKYQLAVANMGYQNKNILLKDTIAVVEAGNILIVTTSKQLNTVTVTAIKPLMKQEVDKLTYDVQADPESKVVTALDMIRKVPLLSVDASDNIKLRGSGSYKILINGKESAMMARNPSDILKAMPGSNIVSIEVITTPPAKYDAEGLAGIINIITTKKGAQGYNGSVGVNYNTVWGYRANLSLTIKQGKIGYSGFVGSGKNPSMYSRFGNESTFYSPQSTLVQDGLQSRGGNNTYNSNELSFEIDTLNLITATYNHFNGTNTSGNDQTTFARNAAKVLTQQYYLSNRGTGDYKGQDMGINYQLGFKHNKGQLLTASYKYSNSDNTQFNNIISDHGLGYKAPDYRQFNNSGSQEYTTQLDYIHPLKTITIEAGGKMILRDIYSNSVTDTLTTGNQYLPDDKQVNILDYNQNVYSLYNSYQLKFTNWTFKGGLRFELTKIKAGGLFDERYNNLVPSFSAQRTINAGSNITFGFTQRIQRPIINQLNPFADRSNPNFITMGNLALRPAITNNFELGYSNFAKGSVNISAHYAFANNTIQPIVSVNGTVTTNSYANVGSNKNLGLDANIQYPITSKIDVNINAQLMQVYLKGTYKGDFFTNSGQQGHIFTFTSFKLNGGYRVGVQVGFDSRYVFLQGRDNFYFNNSFSGSKEILNKKATISLFFSNPFAKFNKLDFFNETPDYITYNYRMNFLRTFGFNFMYKFGKFNGSIKKNQRGINNDDAANGRD